ncbi:hypothetical protein LGT39_05850 [Demequina sp. TTPB684]|uniref:hypothetical protein n=1 Tax=unclassified Demequina TaxID=2620311 RepID=UPI001CF269DA|nr:MULTISPECIES: hypothetical protein [unclassified Demequina]MCB2412371.1 hypothetical protein [Demequina sp. TTPB684]UPU89041.1 hypothetical protein LGT36_003705 [Demequina sp. TMPB413]
MKLAATLPKADDDYMRNGLAVHAADVVRHPDERRIAIVVLSTAKLIDNRASHSVEPVMAIDRIELVRPRDAGDAERLLTRALEERTSPNTLPLFIRDDVKEAFAEGAVQHSTGEVHATVLKFGKGVFNGEDDDTEQDGDVDDEADGDVPS